MFKTIIKSLSKNKTNVFILFILIFLGVNISLATFTDAFTFVYHERSIRKTMNTDLSNIFDVRFNTSEETVEFITRLTKFKKKIGEINGVVGVGVYDTTGMSFEELESNELFIEINSKTYVEDRYKNYLSNSKMLYIDKSLLDVINIGIKSSEFNIKDGYSPLFIGKNYKDILPIGTILTDSYTGTKYIIRGVIYDREWLSDDDPIRMPVQNLNSNFVAPFDVKDKTDIMSVLSTMHKTFLIFDENVHKEVLLVRINKIAKEMGLNISLNSYENIYQDYIYENREVIFIKVALASSILICSLLTIISNLCISIIKRKYEFGIRIAYGTSVSQIIKLCFSELVIITLIASLLAYISYYFSIKNGLNFFLEINYKILISYSILFIFVMVIMIVSMAMIVPIHIIRRFSPCELMKG